MPKNSSEEMAFWPPNLLRANVSDSSIQEKQELLGYDSQVVQGEKNLPDAVAFTGPTEPKPPAFFLEEEAEEADAAPLAPPI